MYEIVIRDQFRASHALAFSRGIKEKQHKHCFAVELFVHAGRLDPLGMVVDFRILRSALRTHLKALEMNSIGKHPFFVSKKLNPSTENIARMIYDELCRTVDTKRARMVKVTVWETAQAGASYWSSKTR